MFTKNPGKCPLELKTYILPGKAPLRKLPQGSEAIFRGGAIFLGAYFRGGTFPAGLFPGGIFPSTLGCVYLKKLTVL